MSTRIIRAWPILAALLVVVAAGAERKAMGCDQAHNSQTARVEYRAAYYFYDFYGLAP